MKFSKVTPVFKIGDLKEISNCRSIFLLPCFSKILEPIMHNRLCSYLVNETILHSKQFCFEKDHSTDDAIAHCLTKFMNHLKMTITYLGLFIDLSKALIMELREKILPGSEVI